GQRGEGPGRDGDRLRRPGARRRRPGRRAGPHAVRLARLERGAPPRRGAVAAGWSRGLTVARPRGPEGGCGSCPHHGFRAGGAVAWWGPRGVGGELGSRSSFGDWFGPDESATTRRAEWPSTSS